jgi:predicted AlkP superfamily phosphohydrolase/phosphomutase
VRRPGHKQPTPRPEPDRPSDPAKRATLKTLIGLGLLAATDMGALVSCGRKRVSSLGVERKVILLGLDGLDPRLTMHWMADGKLPNLSRLEKAGGFRSVASSVPPQSPVAWATFTTGRDPGGHGIYDFILRDPQTYLPYFSIAKTASPKRTLSVGRWKLPLSHGQVELLRKGRAFWELLDERGIPSVAYRVPSNFPPRDTGTRQLAGLGAPDLRGTYGEFSYYGEVLPPEARDVSGGSVQKVTVSNGRARLRLVGPEDTLRVDSAPSHLDFEIWLDRGNRMGKIVLQEQEVLLRQGEWSEWVPLRFEMMPHLSYVSGACRFYLKEVSPHLKLYVTPINVDPFDPALPVAAPRGLTRELAERFGRFYTMGFPEDVKALRHGALDDGEYLHQSGLVLSEERRIYEAALDEFDRGLLFHYFSATDRTQHMFWRLLDPTHPAYDAQLAREHGRAIEECYRTADELVGQALEAVDDRTTLIVMSDHGFAPFSRDFSLNSWLAERGYLVGREPWEGGADIFTNADWERTVAYGLGFNALYLNLRGREGSGSVGPDESDALLSRLAEELRQARDPETGARPIANVYLARKVYTGGRSDRAPDLVIGYAAGYRCSDASVLGEVSPQMVADNRDKWSGDHCIDRALVPAVLFANKPIRAQAPALPDVTASVLAEFGIATPEEMQGTPVW